MSRRSPSPEGVGDLLKQDSFDEFGDEDDNGVQDFEMNEADSLDVTLDEQPAASEDHAEKANGGASQGAGRQPIPIPSFQTSSQAASQGVAQGGNAAALKGGRGPARYFIVKSNIHSNIEQSIKYGIWATQKHNEDKFVDAFKSASHVYLIFSVNMSGHFQGYARMVGFPFRHQPGLWEGGAAVANSFNIEWVRRFDLPFRETEQLRNPINENKPIKISRDGQELPLPLGERVVRLFNEGADLAGVPKPPKAMRDPSIRAGPAVTGPSFGNNSGGRGMGRGMYAGRGVMGEGPGGGRGPGGPMGMIMTPMGPMPAQMAMQMGLNPMMDMNMLSNPMMGMDGMGPMAGMHPMMGNRMQGMMNKGLGPKGPGPVPPPKPPRSPPPRDDEDEYMEALMKKMRSMRGRGEPGRNREEDMLLKALQLTRRGSPPGRDRRRSRTPSPRRGRSRRRSPSRSRSRSRDRGRTRARAGEDLLEMSYDDYLEAYNVLKKSKKEKEDGRDLGFGGGMSNGGNPMMAQMASMMGNKRSQQPANPMMAQMQGMMQGRNDGAGQGPGNMSEEDYLRVWENYSKMSGRPFDAQTVRGWYRSHKQMSSMK